MPERFTPMAKRLTLMLLNERPTKFGPTTAPGRLNGPNAPERAATATFGRAARKPAYGWVGRRTAANDDTEPPRGPETDRKRAAVAGLYAAARTPVRAAAGLAAG